MATITSNFLTLADLASQLDPDGKPATIIDLMSQSNAVVDSMLWMEGNLPTGHKITQKTSLPGLQSRAFGQGVSSQKSTQVQITETCGMFAAVSDIDVKLAELGGNVNAVRLNEDKSFIEGMTQGFASKLWYGDESIDPNSFNGMARRYGTLNSNYGAQYKNTLDLGGTGSVNSSIYIMTWGATSGTAGIFPKGTQAGLVMEDKGKVIKYNSDGSSLEVFQTRFYWSAGLVVPDWRFNVRLCNIDSTLVGIGASSPDLILALDGAIGLLPKVQGAGSYRADPTRPSGMVGDGRTEIYMNRTVFTALKQQCSFRRNMLLNFNQAAPVPYFDWNGVPIRVTDSILNTEARVTTAQPT